MSKSTQLLGSREVAQLLGISRATLTRWVRDGRITPANRLSGTTGAYLFDAVDIDKVKARIERGNAA